MDGLGGDNLNPILYWLRESTADGLCGVNLNPILLVVQKSTEFFLSSVENKFSKLFEEELEPFDACWPSRQPKMEWSSHNGITYSVLIKQHQEIHSNQQDNSIDNGHHGIP